MEQQKKIRKNNNGKREKKQERQKKTMIFCNNILIMTFLNVILRIYLTLISLSEGVLDNVCKYLLKTLIQKRP